MEFQRAIESHLAWKRRYFSALRHGDPPALKASLAEDGTTCQLGRWIEDRYGSVILDPYVLQLQERHGEFHRLAGILARLDLSSTDPQRMLVEGRIQELSEQVLEDLGLLRIHLGLADSEKPLVQPHA